MSEVTLTMTDAAGAKRTLARSECDCGLEATVWLRDGERFRCGDCRERERQLAAHSQGKPAGAAMSLETFQRDAKYGSGAHPTPETVVKDHALLVERIEHRLQIDDRPLVGDWVRLPDDSLRRVTYDWGDGIQLTMPGWDSSFYFGKDGYCSFSGSLCPPVGADHFTRTDEVRDASVWFFSGDSAGAHRGVYCMAPFRVWAIDVPPAY